VQKIEKFRTLLSKLDQVNTKAPGTKRRGNPAYDLRTDRFRNVYTQHLTELLDLGLAGPFHAIAANGNCDYLFKNNVLRRPEDLLDWGAEVAGAYREYALSVNPENADELADQRDLLLQADIIDELSHLAYSITYLRISSMDEVKPG
jgi:hypothetical protein